MDFRDADYEDGGGQYGFGTGYSANPDLTIYYNQGNGNFYKDPNLTQQIFASIAVWEDGRKSPAVPNIPVTVKNNFDGSGGGQDSADGALQDSPYKHKWTVDGSNHRIAAISPQTINSLIYQFSSWTDGGGQGHFVLASLDNFGAIFTANFSVQKPTQVTGVTAGGTIGYPVHISWNAHLNSGVNYYIYRKVRHNGVTGNEVLLTTLSHSTTSYDDPDYILVGHSSDLLYYDVRAHHDSSGTFADPWWTCAGYGQIQQKPSPFDRPGNDQVTTYEVRVHPNPFNPSTTIDYQLAGAGEVRLEIYDILGRVVTELVHEPQQAGHYSLVWNAASAASGVYYCRLTVTTETGRQVATILERVILAR
jgi:hypothetical protein